MRVGITHTYIGRISNFVLNTQNVEALFQALAHACDG